MHIKHGKPKPYRSSLEALAEWVETATCVAVRLNVDGALILFAPHGIDDLVNLAVRPVPIFKNNLDTFRQRVKSKNWKQRWSNLTFSEE